MSSIFLQYLKVSSILLQYESWAELACRGPFRIFYIHFCQISRKLKGDPLGKNPFCPPPPTTSDLLSELSHWVFLGQKRRPVFLNTCTTPSLLKRSRVSSENTTFSQKPSFHLAKTQQKCKISSEKNILQVYSTT